MNLTMVILQSMSLDACQPHFVPSLLSPPFGLLPICCVGHSCVPCAAGQCGARSLYLPETCDLKEGGRIGTSEHEGEKLTAIGSGEEDEPSTICNSQDHHCSSHYSEWCTRDCKHCSKPNSNPQLLAALQQVKGSDGSEAPLATWGEPLVHHRK